jgi:hypothetical protein
MDTRLDALEAAPGGSGTGASNLINVRDYIGSVVAGDWAPAFAAARLAFLAAVAAGDPCGGIFVPADPLPYTVKKPGSQIPSINLRGLNNFILCGDGPGSVIQMTGSGGGGSWHMIAIGGTSANVRVSNLTLDGNKDNLTNLDPSEQTHLVIVAGTIAGGSADRITFDNVTFKNADGDGIAILPLTGDYGAGETASGVDVLACRFLDCDRSGISNQRNAELVTIGHCYFKGIRDQSIDFEPTSGVGTARATRRYIIMHNVIVHNTVANAVSLSGISATDPSLQNIFAYNQLIGGVIGANDAQDMLLQGNVIIGGLDDASPLLNLLGTAKNVRVYGNHFERPIGATCADILHMSTSGGGFATGVSFVNNVFVMRGGAGGDNCIALLNGTDIRFFGNTIENYHAPTFALNTMALASVGPANNATFTIDSGGPAKTYTFKTTLTGAANEVKLGATNSDTCDNIVAAITAGAGAGTKYGTGTTAHTTVTARVGRSDTVTITALVSGTSGNNIITVDSVISPDPLAANLLFSSGTLLGGGNITQAVKIAASSGSAANRIEFSENTIIGSSGGGTLTYGVLAVADGGALSRLRMNHNEFVGCTNWMWIKISVSPGGGTITGHPIVIGNDGPTGNPFESTTFTTGDIKAILIAGNSSHVAAYVGNGDPEGVVTAAIGSTFQRIDGGAGTSWYIKESGTGNTGWVAV